MPMKYDFAIVGAGIVGLSAAYKLHQAYPDATILILEKEDKVAAHQTGRNSGVVHSGIYYAPGSYRAKNCVEGRHQLEQFVAEHNVAYKQCGKVIVANSEDQVDRLVQIYQNGLKNGIEGIRVIDKEELEEIEPHAYGVRAIHVPCAGIVDFAGMCRKMVELMNPENVHLELSQAVRGINRRNGQLKIQTDTDHFEAGHVINCAGLYSDHVARASGLKPDIQIVPFRGEYYKLKPHAEHLVNGLIYPMPNPEFPFLGVHFTKMALGGVECGPNAVFAFKREGYDKYSFDLEETIETLNFSGFWKLAGEHWKMGLDEMYRSFSKSAFVRDLQRLIPSIREKDLEPSPSGVRAMALDPNGEIVDDFKFAADEKEIHVLNAPSPAATAGLAIGDEIVKRAREQFAL